MVVLFYCGILSDIVYFVDWRALEFGIVFQKFL
jgi:hypothetical protein